MSIHNLQELTKELEVLTKEFKRTSLGRKCWGKTDEQIKQLAIPLLKKLFDDKGYSVLAQINFFDWIKPLNPLSNAARELKQLKMGVEDLTERLKAATDTTQADQLCQRIHEAAASAFDVFYSLGNKLTTDPEEYPKYREIVKKVLTMDKGAEAELAQVKRNLREKQELVKKVEPNHFATAASLAVSAGKGMLSYFTNPVQKVRQVYQAYPVATTVVAGVAVAAAAGYLVAPYVATAYSIIQGEAFWRTVLVTGGAFWVGFPMIDLTKKRA